MENIKSKLELNYSFFSRNRHREEEYDNIFSITYKSLSILSNILFLVLFPPAIAISNLFSKDVFLSIMNIFLSIGYCAKFIHKIQFQEVSTLELVTSLLFLAACIVVAFYLAPTISLISIFEIIRVVNLIATGINAFFLVRNLLVPPVEELIKYTLSSLGFHVDTSFFKKTPLSLEIDRPVIDRLIKKFHKHDSFSDEFHEDHLIPFNNILSVLSHYINKYNTPFLGNLVNQERINALENAVSHLIIHGNTDNSLTFIHRKIDFKESKINLLKQSLSEFKTMPKNEHYDCTFFKRKPSITKHSPEDAHQAGVELFEQEIARQGKKLASLKACIPTKY